MKHHFELLLSFALVLLLLPGLALADDANLPVDYLDIGQHRFFTDGPVRYPAASWKSRVFVGSDDGYLYCLDAKSGKLHWKFRGGPTARKMLGGGRLISAWPVSGGPVVHEDRVYFAAGIWPFMGVFVYALDAQTGQVHWVNDNATTRWKSLAISEQRPDKPEFEASFISVAPMGQLSIDGDRLVVPCGRAAPAYFDLATGELLSFHHGRHKPHEWGEGNLSYPNYDAIAAKHQGCFPRDQRATAVVSTTGVRDGYALVLGIGDGRMVESLVAHSKLRVIAIDPDSSKAAALRKRLDKAGVYGTRVSVHVGDPLEFGLPPYVASLITSADLPSAGIKRTEQFWQTIFRSLRPYGGVACFEHSGNGIVVKDMPGAKLEHQGKLLLLKRDGPLPGADDWSHEFANSANTRSSDDDLVKSPFATLWSGGPAAEVHRYYENHRGYAVPKVAGGRLFVEGPKLISAFDVYTGRFLWEWRPDADDQEVWGYAARGVHLAFEPLAGRTAASEDALYVMSDQRLYALDASTGKPLPRFHFTEKSDWGGVRIEGNMLLLPSAKSVLALDRHTGKVLWRQSTIGGTLAVGGGKVFCIEYPWPDRFNNAHLSPNSRWMQFIKDRDKIKRRGLPLELKQQRLAALDQKTGSPIWEITLPVGRSPIRRLIYSEKHDLLLLPGASKIYYAADGKKAWGVNLMDSTTVSGDLVWGYGKLGVMANLKTREVNQRINPITLEAQKWSLRKTGNGCGPIAAGRHLVTLRSGSAAYYDLNQTCGIVNLGGFRSSCQPSLIPADGLLVSPNSASGGCSCRYPLASALAMVHAPEMQKWGSYGNLEVDGPVRRLGINFGAPGDRFSDNNVLWVDYPSVGGPSPEIAIRTVPERPEWFRHHPSRVTSGEDHAWVGASGAKHLTSISIKLKNKSPRTYRVRTYYARPDDAEGKLKMIVKETASVQATDVLKWNFTERLLVCGIEIVEIEDQ